MFQVVFKCHGAIYFVNGPNRRGHDLLKDVKHISQPVADIAKHALYLCTSDLGREILRVENSLNTLSLCTFDLVLLFPGQERRTRLNYSRHSLSNVAGTLNLNDDILGSKWRLYETEVRFWSEVSPVLPYALNTGYILDRCNRHFRNSM